jgi:hypothetical protein
MAGVFESLEKACDFLRQHPDLDGSTLLKKETNALVKALGKFNEKAEEVKLSLTADYAEAAALLEGDGKPLATPAFIREFTKKHCTTTLSFSRANKRERTALLLRAARDGKLSILKELIDPSKKFRQMYQALLSKPTADIKREILAMKPAVFRGIVNAAGLSAPRTKAGAVSTAKTARKKVLHQIIRSKQSDKLMDSLVFD